MTVFDQCTLDVWDRQIAAAYRLLAFAPKDVDNDAYLDSLEELTLATKESRDTVIRIRQQGS